MFSLHTSTFPSSAPELERLIHQSLQRIFSLAADPVSIRDASYPHIEEIRISLDGARLRPPPPRTPAISGKTSPALRVDRLSISASHFSPGPAALDLSLSARAVNFVQGKGSDDQVVLSLAAATEGKLGISVAQTDLEALVVELARAEAGKQGIAIDGARLQLRRASGRSLVAEVRLRVRKFFLSASLRVTGQLDLDDRLNLKISALNCTGDGAIASLACGILAPYLQRIDGREFPLTSFPLGGVRLHDVQVAVDDKLSVIAGFGSAI